MKIKDLFWKKRFNQEEFYYQVLNDQIPLEYKDVGKYLKNIFLCYDYNDDLVKEAIETVNELKNNNFNFVNMEYIKKHLLIRIIKIYITYGMNLISFF